MTDGIYRHGAPEAMADRNLCCRSAILALFLLDFVTPPEL
jgi:hypothetical protein